MSSDQPVLTDVASTSALLEAWTQVFAKASTSGNPPRSLVRFRENLPENLEKIGHELQDGTFEPGGLHLLALRAPGRKDRMLAIPPIRTRIVERALVTALQPELDLFMSSVSFGYRPSSSVKQALGTVLAFRDEGATHAVSADIAECFASINIQRLEAHIGEAIVCADIRALIARLLRRPLPGGGALQGLPQGAPLSPLLCNLYLDELDTLLAGSGIRAIRYADDLLIPAESAEAAERSLVVLRREVSSLGMSLNPTRTSVMSFKEGFTFLGERLDSLTPRPEAELIAPGRETLYVAKPGARIAASRGRVRVLLRDDELLSAPQSQVGRVVTFGAVGISAGLRQWALNSQADVVLLSARGKLLGSLTASGAATIRRRMRQYSMVRNAQFSTALAVRIVRGKIANGRSLLQRYLRPEAADAVRTALERMKAGLISASDASSVNSARGFEGFSASAYWTAFAALVPDELGFCGRRRPPTDPVNAALSLGYVLLAGEAVGALAAAGLDPAAGFLHTERDGRASLAYDLIEEFRPLIVDTVVLELARRGMLGVCTRQDGAVRLGEKSSAVLFRRFENRMLTIFSCVPARQRCSYRRALHYQAQRIAACVESGDATNYWPVTWRA